MEFTADDFRRLAQEIRARVADDAMCHVGITSMNECGRCSRLLRTSRALHEAASQREKLDRIAQLAANNG